MELKHLLWSATTCDYPGAGLYFGLSLHSEHVALARHLTTRQVRIMTGGAATLRAGDAACPLNYFAVRDPSGVKVKPVDKPPLHNGFRHVKLSCTFDRPQATQESEQVAKQLEEEGRRLCAGRPPSTAAFLLTIGLTIAREDKFFHDAVMAHPGQGWDELYQRMKDLGCRADSMDDATP